MFGQQAFTRRKRVPSVLQFEAVECGAASLSMIIRSWGLYLPLSEVRLGCGVNRDGSNLKDIALYAQSLGVNRPASVYEAVFDIARQGFKTPKLPICRDNIDMME